MEVRIKTDLSTEPVSSAEAKLWCKVTGTAEDSIFAILVPAARKALEKYTASSFGQKTIYATWDEMPEDNEIILPYGPIISVDKIYKIDSEGTESELTLNSDYWISGDNEATITIGQSWSTGYVTKMAYRIEYTAGYGHANTETLPTDLKLAIMKQVATDYMLRENIAVGTISSTLDNESKKLAAPYRRKLWF